MLLAEVKLIASAVLISQLSSEQLEERQTTLSRLCLRYGQVEGLTSPKGRAA